MDHRMIARGLLGLLSGLQGMATLVIDFNRTHATNPEWTKHARFHLVWQDITAFLMSLITVTLLLWDDPHADKRFYLAALLTCVPLLGFLGAFVGRKMYRGALSDANGIPRARLSVLGKVREIDMNLFAVVAALFVLAASLAFYMV